jgi:hypothetical protein
MKIDSIEAPHLLDVAGLSTGQRFFSIRELARRWRCSRGSVYNRLRAANAKVVDFSKAGKRGSKLVPLAVVREIEARNLKPLC